MLLSHFGFTYFLFDLMVIFLSSGYCNYLINPSSQDLWSHKRASDRAKLRAVSMLNSLSKDGAEEGSPVSRTTTRFFTIKNQNQVLQ